MTRPAVTDPTPAATVEVVLPEALADLVDRRRHLAVPVTDATLGGLLDALAATNPVLVRRIRDDTGALRRYVNVYVDDEDARRLDGLATPLADGAVVRVLPSVAGG